jgi:hypothetical protein
MAGERTIPNGDIPCIISQSGGVEAGRGVVLHATTEDAVSYAGSNNSSGFAGVAMANCADGGRIERRTLGHALVRLNAAVTAIGTYGYLLTTGKFAPIVASSTPQDYYACVRFLRAGAVDDLVPAEVLCPPRFMQA